MYPEPIHSMKSRGWGAFQKIQTPRTVHRAANEFLLKCIIFHGSVFWETLGWFWFAAGKG